MTSTKQELKSEIDDLLLQIKQYLTADVSKGPEVFICQAGHTDLQSFYNIIDKYDRLLESLKSKISSGIIDSERLIDKISRSLSSEDFLFVRFRRLTGGGYEEFDFNDRGLGHNQSRLDWITHCYRNEYFEEQPKHCEKLKVQIDAVESLKSFLGQQIDILQVVGEPTTLGIDVALKALTTLPFLENTGVREHLLKAEGFFLQQQWADGASNARKVIETLFIGIQSEAIQRGVATANKKTVRDIRENLLSAKVGTAEILHYLYGVYSLMSFIGSHTHTPSEAEGRLAWNAFLSAMGILAEVPPLC